MHGPFLLYLNCGTFPHTCRMGVPSLAIFALVSPAQVDNAIRWINDYQVDNVIGFPKIHKKLSGRWIVIYPVDCRYVGGSDWDCLYTDVEENSISNFLRVGTWPLSPAIPASQDNFFRLLWPDFIHEEIFWLVDECNTEFACHVACCAWSAVKWITHHV